MIALDRLAVITPLAIALPNKALATSLQQVAGITNLSLPEFATTVALQQTTNDLPLITAQTEPVSQSTLADLLNKLGAGTGARGTYTIEDILGTEAGLTQPQLANAVSILNTMITANAIVMANLIATYTTMANVVNGDFGDPVLGPVVIPTGPYANTYANAEEAFGNALLTGAQTDITGVIAFYPTQTTQLNTDFNSIAQQVQSDKSTQAKAQIVFADFTANSTAIVNSFALSLPQYGLNTVTDGSTQFLNNTATTSNLGGQAIIATLRQGSNEAALNSVGIQTTTHIPL